DIGRALNPVLARGQVEGSIYMALGEALMEEMDYRRLPRHLSSALVHKFPSMLEYKSPTTLEMPEVITYLVEDPDDAGPYGAKEVGQGPLLPVMPALANALYDAVGIRVDEVPITPEKILRALGDRRAHRCGPKSFPLIEWPEPLHVSPPWEGGDGKAQNEGPRRRREGAIVAPDVAQPGLSPHPSTPEGRREKSDETSPAPELPEVLR
ncbi:MAG: molybdopterin-dependent oxidoreductase, partial [Acidobacteria bacterium]|nr:molybdopterin-dependent oxidoreductase [Acidobacteriota bacterium]